MGGLVDESRRPKRSPLKTSAELALEIVQLRKDHPRWGPKKIVAIMARRHPDMKVPTVVTVARVLRHGARSRYASSHEIVEAPGKVKQKTLPCPNSLSAQMRPPCDSMIHFEM